MDTTKSYTVKEALLALSRYCVYQDRCHQEVEQKLKKYEYDSGSSCANHFRIDKRRLFKRRTFCHELCLGKFNQKGWGKIKIRQELKRRQISDYLLQKALNQINEVDYRKQIT